MGIFAKRKTMITIERRPDINISGNTWFKLYKKEKMLTLSTDCSSLVIVAANSTAVTILTLGFF